MAVSKIAVRKTVEFLLYIVMFMVYMGIAYLFGYDMYSFESNWALFVYCLVLNFLTGVTVSCALSLWASAINADRRAVYPITNTTIQTDVNKH